MTIRKICVDEITTYNTSYNKTVICNNPNYTPAEPGDECNVHLYNVGVDLASTPPNLSFSFDAQFEYSYLHNGGYWSDYCDINGMTGSVDLPTGVTLCCGVTMPNVSYTATCNAAGITVDSNSVSGPVDLSFTVSNLCTPTVICIDDTICP